MQNNIQAAYFAFILHSLTTPHALSAKILRFFENSFLKPMCIMLLCISLYFNFSISNETHPISDTRSSSHGLLLGVLPV